MTTRRALIATLAAGALTAPGRAQQPKRLRRVALVFSETLLADMAGSDPTDQSTRTFVHALRDLGHVEGRDIVVERRSAEGRLDRLPGMMQALVASQVDVIVVEGATVSAAQAATDTIPIVALVDEFIVAGLAANLARPGRNLTGISGGDPSINGKRMQLLKELAPRVKRVAAVARRLPPGRPRGAWRIATQAGADALGVELVWVGVDTADDLEPAFATIVRERCDALYVVLTEVNIRHRRHIIDLAARHRLPAVYWERQFVDAGGLISYGESDAWVYRRAAAYVDKILKGARPADLPVEQPTAFELVINLKAAKALGLAVPQALRLRADEVIE